MIIDFHTHCFPDKIAPHAISSLENSSNTKAFLNGTMAQLEQSMEKAGIDFSVVMPIAVKPKQTRTINTVAIENNKRQKLYSFGSVHPYYEDWKDELLRIKKAGLKGIKLHPDFQGVFIDDPKMVEVMAEAARLKLLITIHAGMDVSYPDLHRSTPKRLYGILPGLKGAKIICAHSGGYAYLDDVERYLLDKDEIYIDTSYSIGHSCMDTEQLKRIYTTINPQHVLFGTDSPWSDQSESIKEIKQLGLPKDLEDKIFYKNAQRLLNL